MDEFEEEIQEIKEVEDPEDDNLEILCNSIKKRLRRKLDCVLAISGEDTGIGKSSLGISMGMKIDPNFDLIKNIAYLPIESEIREKFNKVDKFGCFDVDEAAKSFYKLNWNDKFQKILNQDFMTNRKGNYKCTQLLIPRFIDLNEFFRNYKVKLNIYIPYRGIGIIYSKNKLPFVRDPWNLDENYKLMSLAMGKKKLSEIKIDQMLRILKRSKNYAGTLFFNPLPKELEKLYMKKFNEEKAREEKINAEGSSEEKANENRNMRTIALAKTITELKKNGYTQKRISELVGLSTSSVTQILKTIGETEMEHMIKRQLEVVQKRI